MFCPIAVNSFVNFFFSFKPILIFVIMRQWPDCTDTSFICLWGCSEFHRGLHRWKFITSSVIRLVHWWKSSSLHGVKKILQISELLAAFFLRPKTAVSSILIWVLPLFRTSHWNLQRQLCLLTSVTQPHQVLHKTFSVLICYEVESVKCDDFHFGFFVNSIIRTPSHEYILLQEMILLAAWGREMSPTPLASAAPSGNWGTTLSFAVNPVKCLVLLIVKCHHTVAVFEAEYRLLRCSWTFAHWNNLYEKTNNAVALISRDW